MIQCTVMSMMICDTVHYTTHCNDNDDDGGLSSQVHSAETDFNIYSTVQCNVMDSSPSVHCDMIGCNAL